MPSCAVSLDRGRALLGAPGSALALVVPWDEVKRDFTYPVEVIVTIAR